MIFVEVVRTLRVSACALTAAVLLQLHPVSAQTLTFSLLGRYFDALRSQAGIPAISVAVVQSGAIVWDAGLGKQNVEDSIFATADTAYPIGDLSQTLASTLLLQKCLEQSHLEISDRIVRWIPDYREPQTTVAQLLSHTSTSGAYKYDPAR